MAIILDGKKIAEGIKAQLKEKIQSLKIKPCLAIIQVGSDDRSTIYINNKKLFGEAIGAHVWHIHLESSNGEEGMIRIINELNNDGKVHGIILQLPLPEHLDKEMLLKLVRPKKDVDGLSSDRPLHTPATARGVMTMLKAYDIEVKNKKVVVIGRSQLVGSPIARCLKKAGADVVSCDKSTQNIPEITKQADIVVVAAGSPKLVTLDYVKENQVIVDVGINSVTAEGDLVSHPVGDVDFPAVSKIVGAISPVPGGVGPLTVASLFENLFDAVEN